MSSIAVSTSRRPAAPSTLLIFAGLILGLAIYFGMIDNPLMHPGQEMTRFNPQVAGAASWQTILFDSTPALPGLGHAYRPILPCLLRFEWRAWGESPSSFHAFSLLLFGGLLCVFALLAGRLIEHPLGRWAALLVFAAHPMASESILSIPGQGPLFSLLASLAACLALTMYRQGSLGAAGAAAAIFFGQLFAVGSSETGLLLPLWLGAIAWLVPLTPPEAKGAPKRRRQRDDTPEEAAPAPQPARVWPWFVFPPLAAIAAYLALRNVAMHGLLAPKGDLAAAWEGIGVSRLAGGPSVMLLGALRLLWPAAPTLVYDPASHAGLLPAAAFGWIFLILMLAAIGAGARRNRVLAFGLILLLSGLAALSQWIPLPFFFSEQSLLFALPGLALVAGRLMEMAAFSRALGHLSGQRALAAALAILTLGLAWQAHRRSGEWSDERGLWRSEAARHPNSAEPQIELIAAEYRPGQPDAALEAVAKGRKLAVRADDLDRIIEGEARIDAAEKRTQELGALLESELDAKRPHRAGHLEELTDIAAANGMPELAEELARKQIEIDPLAFKANFALAKAEYDRGRSAEALKFAQKAAQSAPPSMRSKVFTQYAEILANLGHTNEAVLQLNEALRLDYTNYVAYIQLARLYRGRKDYDQALMVLQQCGQYVKLESIVDIATIFMGIKADQGQVQEGLTWLEGRVASLRGDVQLQLLAAEIFIRYGEDRRALNIYQSLQGLTPQQRVEQLAGLGKLEWTMHRDRDRAVMYFQQALQASPGNRVVMELIDSVNKEAAAPAPVASPAASPAATPLAGGSAASATGSTSETAAPAEPVSGGGVSLGGK